MTGIVKGATDQTIDIFVQDSSASTGAGLTGLVFNTASLTCYYRRGATGTPTALSLVTQTVGGAHTDGGFVAVDGTNAPGLYRLDLSDAICASGVERVYLYLRGAANMSPVVKEIELLDPTSTALNTVRKNAALAGFPFKMVDATDLKTAETGATITATRSLDGAAFGACANSATEISNGWYKIDLAAADLNANTVVLRFTATGCHPTEITLFPQPT
jgi:hypothetical protein